MRFLVITLTILTVLLFIRQFFGSKGTKSHIVRGVLIGILSVTGVIINTIFVSLQRGLVWDIAFITHIALGAGFFLGLIVTCILGWQTMHKRELRVWHRLSAHMTRVFLFLTLSAAALIPLVR